MTKEMTTDEAWDILECVSEDAGLGNEFRGAEALARIKKEWQRLEQHLAEAEYRARGATPWSRGSRQ